MRGAQVCIEYDTLGQPTLHQAKLSNQDWQTVATYSYDTGDYGIERLASTRLPCSSAEAQRWSMR